LAMMGQQNNKRLGRSNHLLVCVDKKQLDDIYATTLGFRIEYEYFVLYTLPIILRD